MNEEKKKLVIWPVYLMSLVLFTLGLFSYSTKYITFAIIVESVSFILFLLALLLQLIEHDQEYRIYYFTIFVVLTAPLSIYSLGLFTQVYKLNIIQFGLSGDWIGFAGSIIGGAMTMFALIFTIQHETKIRKQEKIDLKRPYIDLDFERSKTNQKFIKCYEAEENIELFLHVSNISNNIVRNFEIIKLERYIENNAKYKSMLINEQIIDAIIVTTYSKLHLIKANEAKQLFLCFDHFDSLDVKRGVSRILDFKVKSKFFDVNGNGPYYHDSEFRIIHSVVRKNGKLLDNFLLDTILNKAI